MNPKIVGRFFKLCEYGYGISLRVRELVLVFISLYIPINEETNCNSQR